MNAWEAFWVGIAPHHRPAAVAALLVFVGAGLLRVRRRAPATPAPGTGPVERWAAALLGISAAVHLALPLGHTTTGCSRSASSAAAPRTPGSPCARSTAGAGGCRPRCWSSPRSSPTSSWPARRRRGARPGRHRHRPGRAGRARAVPVPPARRPDRLKRFARAPTATVAATFVVGAAIWVGSFVAHAATDADVHRRDGRRRRPRRHTGDHAHEHDHAARAQAGVIMRPSRDHHPTAGADRGGRTGWPPPRRSRRPRRYADLDAALAAGYQASPAGTGPDVHLENKAYGKDGRILDPQRPETARLRDRGRPGDAARRGVRDGAGRRARPRAGRADHPAGTRTTSASPRSRRGSASSRRSAAARRCRSA